MPISFLLPGSERKRERCSSTSEPVDRRRKAQSRRRSRTNAQPLSHRSLRITTFLTKQGLLSDVLDVVSEANPDGRKALRSRCSYREAASWPPTVPGLW